ncbi:jg11188 [Pararge aegeria aegeria]|uniref:Protein yellow n=1 Tax=Pararge aegeria aegeria TaxID=348720 RepID=A0A8S4RIY2_9NEOP|nr:jg11188 [Pararge aegeria aegeria]
MVGRTLIFCGLIAVASAAVKLQEVYSWNVMDWNYPDQYLKQQALQTGALIRQNALPVGIERWRNKLFVSVPRWRPGIPATLNYIPLDAPYETSPKLTPYPSFKGNELGNCETGLTTVYRIKADKCDRLWVLDVGTYGYDPNVTNVCPYAINVYDLNTDRRIRRYVFRPEDIVSTTFIANIALDEGLTCDDTFAYFSDELGYGLIAYSWEQNKSWRFSHSYFMPDPLVGDFNIAGLNFQWGAEGIFGISASNMGVDGFRTLYFSPLSSNTEFSVSTRILRDETKVTGSYKDFKVVGSRGRDTHTTSKVMDVTGVQLFNLIDQNAIGCWSTNFALKPQNIAIVDKDDVGLVFPCDIKIDDGRNVWVLSDRMPVFLESELNYGDINFRIYIGSVDKLIQGTVCETSPPTIQPTRGPLLSRPNLFNAGGYESVSQVPPRIFLQSTSTRSMQPNFNPQFISSVTSPNAISKLYNPLLNTKQTSKQFTASPLPSDITNNNPWWLKNNGDYQVMENL